MTLRHPNALGNRDLQAEMRDLEVVIERLSTADNQGAVAATMQDVCRRWAALHAEWKARDFGRFAPTFECAA